MQEAVRVKIAEVYRRQIAKIYRRYTGFTKLTPGFENKENAQVNESLSPGRKRPKAKGRIITVI